MKIWFYFLLLVVTLTSPFTMSINPHKIERTKGESSMGKLITSSMNWPTNIYMTRREKDPTERRTRQLSSLSATNLQAAASSDYGYGATGSEYGGYAAAGSHGGGYGHGGGHGGGHGKQDCNSALGLLGVLGLVSFLQNVLRQMTTTRMGRRKRDEGSEVPDSNDIDLQMDHITRLMMPLLMRVGQASDGVIQSHCILPETCRANGILVERLGSHGRSLGTMLSSSIAKMVSETAKKGRKAIGKQIDKAAQSGRDGLKCDELYKECRGIPTLDPSVYDYFLNARRG